MLFTNIPGTPLKALAASAAFGLLALAAASAQAQTNVTIYGRVDAGVDYQTNVALKDANGNPTGQTGSKLAASGNQWGTSMIGFKGTEDLGGGLGAFFLLESGFDATKGTTNGSALFNRRSYVGLNGSAGSIKFGKNLFIVNDVWNLDPTGQQFMSTQNLVKGRNWPGANNVIEYQTPTWGGFNATMQTSLGEQAGSTKNGRSDGISLVYATGGFELRAIYDVIRDANGRYTDVYTASKDLIVGGTYTVDKLKLFAGYENVSAPDTAAATDPDKINHYWIGANYAVTPALTLIGAAYHAKLNHDAGSASLFMVGANYNLSKRTLLYVDVGTVRNKGNADFGTEFDSPLPGHAQNAGYAGISHSF
ncbi:gram-negative porin family protein [Collimonas pratensis]|uniref:Gram-negative porin family protein n=2 Tax=Collimonas pratensis TaxID=279113 RepID=A0ABM5Z9V8_9BURK|nr:porin [Collimonas pratensis]AMP15973.1 gram-negative porin family protein [Collimonas pratensis]